MMRSLLCKGDGKEMDVPGIGREGTINGGGVWADAWGRMGVWGMMMESDNDGSRAYDRGPSQWIPGRSNMWRVCSIITFR